jgi:hypothetical protein
MTGEFETGLEAVKTDLLKTIEQKFDPASANSYTDGEFPRLAGH